MLISERGKVPYIWSKLTGHWYLLGLSRLIFGWFFYGMSRVVYLTLVQVNLRGRVACRAGGLYIGTS